MFYIGIDLGGTHIASGVVDEHGKVIAKAETPTLAKRPYEEVIDDMAACTLEAVKKAGISMDEIHSVGIGIPGIADNETGNVIFCTNLGWTDVPLRARLEASLQKPIYIDNDATVAGFAESVAGISAGCSSSVFLTLGTGVGGGIVLNGKPWTGAHGVASELGHLTLVIDGVQCTCGKRGCVERYCSATALIRLAREACEKHPESLMWAEANQNLDNLDGRLIISCAKKGDEIAAGVFDEYIKYLALTINSIISFIDPEVIVLGGGISHAGTILLDALRAKLPQYLMYKPLPYARIELATLGNEAGVIGAAMLGKSMSEGGTAYGYHHSKPV